MAKFKIGDVVMLKSGGPDMTIVGVSQKIENGYDVKWFDISEELYDSEFPEDALEEVEEYDDDDDDDLEDLDLDELDDLDEEDEEGEEEKTAK